MYKIAALNDDLNDNGCSEDVTSENVPSKEALEAAAHSDHRKAIQLLSQGHEERAFLTFQAVLSNSYVSKTVIPPSDCTEEFSPSLTLKYSCYKNIANLHLKNKKYTKACDYYVKAVRIDSSDVGVCYRLGLSAIQLRQFQLALEAFLQGLNINPNHPICLDQILSVYMILCMHAEALFVCADILSRNASHAKARVFSNYIIKTLPHVADIVKKLSKNSSVLFNSNQPYDRTLGERYLQNCLSIRQEIGEQKGNEENSLKKKLISKVSLKIKEHSWKEILSSFLLTFEKMSTEESNMLSRQVTITKYTKDEMEEKSAEISSASIDHMNSSTDKIVSEPTNCNGNSAAEVELPLEVKLVNKSTDEENKIPIISEVSNQESCENQATIPSQKPLVEESENILAEENNRISSTQNETIQSSSNGDASIVKDETIQNTDNGDLSFVKNETIQNSDNGDLSFVKNETIQNSDNGDLSFVKNETIQNSDYGDVSTVKNETVQSSDIGDVSTVKSKFFDKIEYGSLFPEENEAASTCTGEITFSTNNSNLPSKDEEKLTVGDTANIQMEKNEELPNIENGNTNGSGNDKILKVGKETSEENKELSTDMNGTASIEIKSTEKNEIRPIEEDEMNLTDKNEVENEMQSSEENEMQVTDENEVDVSQEIDSKSAGDDDETSNSQFECIRKDDKSIVEDGANENDNFTFSDTDKLINTPEKLSEMFLKNLSDSYNNESIAMLGEEAGDQNLLPESLNENDIGVLDNSLHGKEDQMETNCIESNTEANSNDDEFVDSVNEGGKLTSANCNKEEEEKKSDEEMQEASEHSPSKDVGFSPKSRQRHARCRRSSRSNMSCNNYKTMANGGTSGKRMVRGLKRELQQLDYWGRRENESSASKRRRRTATDCITTAHLLRSFVPARLSFTETPTDDTTTTASIDKSSNQDTTSTQVSSSHVEESIVVEQFINANEQNYGIVDCLGKLLEKLVLYYREISWPSSIVELYLNLYPKYRESIILISPFKSSSSQNKLLRRHCLTALVYWELVIQSSHESVVRHHRNEDLLQLSLLVDRKDIHSYLKHYHLRYMWLRAQCYLADEMNSHAVMMLNNLLEECENLDIDSIHVCKIIQKGTHVSASAATKQLDSLLRKQLVLHVEEEYSAGHYVAVVKIMEDKLSDDGLLRFANPSEEISHSHLLIKSLIELRDFKGLLEWGSTVLLQLMLHSKKSDSEDSSEDDSDSETNELRQEVISLTLQTLCDIVEMQSDRLLDVSNRILSFLVEALIRLLIAQLEMPDVPEDCMNPWLLLHRVLQTNEVASKAVRPFPSTLLLITAHEELAKMERCCHQNGKLLTFMLPLILEELGNENLPPDSYSSLSQARDQVTYCLFQFPNKKTKKIVKEHSSTGIPLTFNFGCSFYSHYLPESLPQFESSTPGSISEETTGLFKRILEVLPPQYDIQDHIGELNDYLKRDKSDFLVTCNNSLHAKLPHIYYLLGDYYFKNKEWLAAANMYKHDIVMQPLRVDSWAGLALSMKTIIETRLNSCEVISNHMEFFAEIKSTVLCFKRSLQLETTNSNILIELGVLLYWTHSLASRLLKQDNDPDMTMEKYEKLETFKNDMAEQSRSCFEDALKISLEDDEWDDERWLYHYMLAKIGEKTGAPHETVLGSYINAIRDLHFSSASYPSKINYNNPQDYSVEAVEIYFRVHSYILKQLQKTGQVDSAILDYFSTVVEDMCMSPFVTMTEYKEKSEIDGTRKLASVISSDCIESLFAVKESNASTVATKTVEMKTNHIIIKCTDAFKLCVKRFPEHYKSLYRLAQYQFSMKTPQSLLITKAFLLSSTQPGLSALFTDRKIVYSQPKNSNLFNGVWRIPNDEIDRPGNFASHMYRSVSLTLDLLRELDDFSSLLDIALTLKYAPDKDKKYLREDERDHLFEHATQLGLQIVKDKSKKISTSKLTPNDKKVISFLCEVHKCHKNLSRHLSSSESVLQSAMNQTYKAITGASSESTVQFKDIEKFCSQFEMREKASVSRTQSSTTLNMRKNVLYGNDSLKTHTSELSRAAPVPRSTASPLPKQIDQSSLNYTNDVVKKAIETYNNIMKCQNAMMLASKSQPAASLSAFKFQLDIYQKQLLQYFKIPAVFSYFQEFYQQAPQNRTANAKKSVTQTSRTNEASTSQVKNTKARQFPSNQHNTAASINQKTKQASSMKPTGSVTRLPKSSVEIQKVSSNNKKEVSVPFVKTDFINKNKSHSSLVDLSKASGVTSSGNSQKEKKRVHPSVGETGYSLTINKDSISVKKPKVVTADVITID